MLQLLSRFRVPVGVGLFLALGLTACSELEGAGPSQAAGTRAVPVEVGGVERGPLTDRRTVSGNLEAAAEFVVAPKVGGRIVRLEAGLGDPVARGQAVARLDADEFVQAVQQAEADLAVAQAQQRRGEERLRARPARAEALRAAARAEGVTSEAQLDLGRAEEVASLAQQAVPEANITWARATLQTARIRLGYAEVTAD